MTTDKQDNGGGVVGRHTPTPWMWGHEEIVTVERRADNNCHTYVMTIEVDYYGGVAGSPYLDFTNADKAFIIRACNAHTDLLTALKVAYEHCSDLSGDEADAIEAAIAAAESGGAS